jgi:hypothetical protein
MTVFNKLGRHCCNQLNRGFIGNVKKQQSTNETIIQK